MDADAGVPGGRRPHADLLVERAAGEGGRADDPDVAVGPDREHPPARAQAGELDVEDRVGVVRPAQHAEAVARAAAVGRGVGGGLADGEHEDRGGAGTTRFWRRHDVPPHRGWSRS